MVSYFHPQKNGFIFPSAKKHLTLRSYSHGWMSEGLPQDSEIFESNRFQDVQSQSLSNHKTLTWKPQPQNQSINAKRWRPQKLGHCRHCSSYEEEEVGGMGASGADPSWAIWSRKSRSSQIQLPCWYSEVRSVDAWVLQRKRSVSSWPSCWSRWRSHWHRLLIMSTSPPSTLPRGQSCHCHGCPVCGNIFVLWISQADLLK